MAVTEVVRTTKINHADMLGLCCLINLGMACLEVRVLWEVTPCSLVVTFQRIVIFHSNVTSRCFIQYSWDYYYYYYYYYYYHHHHHHQ